MDDSTRAIVGIARGLLDDFDLEAVLQRVLASARDVTGARYAAIGVLDPTRTELTRFLTLGIDERTRRSIGPLPTGRGVLGELMSHPGAAAPRRRQRAPAFLRLPDRPSTDATRSSACRY